MKEFEEDIKQIIDLYNLDNVSKDEVIAVLEHAYQLDCALEATFLEKEEWLKEIAEQLTPDPGWWEYQSGLWEFSGELSHYCQSMSLSEAIDKTLIEWVHK